MSNITEPIHGEFSSAEVDFAQELFTPKMLALLANVGNQLKEADLLEPHVANLYEKIIEPCKRSNNGTTLLALAEVILSLMPAAMKPVGERLPEITE